LNGKLDNVENRCLWAIDFATKTIDFFEKKNSNLRLNSCEKLPLLQMFDLLKSAQDKENCRAGT
jgi:hypothetical protein